MIRINLLPHREMRRERRKKDYVGSIAITALAGGVLAFAGGFVINQQIENQSKAVEDLQSDRTIPVHLFDELVKLMPEGVFLEKLQQQELKVTLGGFAQSNERVAELLRNLSDRSDWLEKPQLDEIKEVMVKEQAPTAQAGKSDIRRAYEFKLNVLIKRQKPEGQEGPGAATLRSASSGAVNVAAAGGSAR